MRKQRFEHGSVWELHEVLEKEKEGWELCAVKTAIYDGEELMFEEEFYLKRPVDNSMLKKFKELWRDRRFIKRS